MRGTYWPQLPVQIQDIEQIEIVRGPNAALYGSNAELGVINIITKRPQARIAGSVEDKLGISAPSGRLWHSSRRALGSAIALATLTGMKTPSST